MAQIILGIGSSHAPQLAMPPERWRAYGDRSRSQPEHWFKGKTYSFPELVEARAEEHFDRECTDEKFQARFESCQKAITHLSETLRRAAPDVCIIFGDDQHEVFSDDNMPPIAIYHGATVDDAPRQDRGGIGGRAAFRDPRVDNAPPDRLSHPAEAELGEYLIEALTANEFDVTRRVAMMMYWSTSRSGIATRAVTVSSLGLIWIRFWMGVPLVWRVESWLMRNTFSR